MAFLYVDNCSCGSYVLLAGQSFLAKRVGGYEAGSWWAVESTFYNSEEGQASHEV